MTEISWKQRLPGTIATALVILTTALWTYWGIGELYYEGWGLPFPEPLAYLVPAAACLVFSLLALRCPRLGGWVLILIGGAFTIWWWALAARRAGRLTLVAALSMFPVSGLLVVTGILFIFEGRLRRRLRAEGWQPPFHWWLRNFRYLLALGIPLLVVIVVSAFQMPLVLNRYDDGERGERLIEANGVRLIWAPEGPGWNWRQKWGGFPSWRSIALYGREPVGLDEKQYPTSSAGDMKATSLCAYLNRDGLSLADKPQYIWRMPTVDELVRSLTRNGENAGCTWDGTIGKVTCAKTPDKETPLWNPKAPPIYYWASDELDEREAYYVSYNGYVSAQPKTFGNPRHGYRCARDPD